MSGPADVKRLPIRVGRRSAPLLRVLFGVRADDAWISLGDGPDGILEVRFGRFGFRTTMGNVAHWQIEGPFRWITAIGVRMSIRHRDVTFGGSHHGGVRIDFRERVPWLVFRVPAIYVPADDLEGLGAELARRGVPGSDVRASRRGGS
jgi:hypothetical protein